MYDIFKNNNNIDYSNIVELNDRINETINNVINIQKVINNKKNIHFFNFIYNVAKDKIRVNCIEPSVIKTDFTKPLWGEPHRTKWFDETTPIGRLSNPDEIIGSVIFLATDASSYITGQSIVIDGGILSGGDWDSYA